jgi:hypothetical protein
MGRCGKRFGSGGAVQTRQGECLMINFEEELKKFHPSLEVEDAEEAIYNQDLTDMTDILIRIMKKAGTDTDTELDEE